MKKFVLLFLSVMASAAQAQQLSVMSTTYYGSSLGEFIETSTPTADGGFVSVGFTNGSDGNIPPHPFAVQAFENYLVMKHDSTGALQWAKQYGGSKIESARYVIQTQDGGYGVLGYTTSYDGDVHSRIDANPNAADLWLMRLDASGNLKWSNCYGTSLSEWNAGLAATPDGGFLMLCGTGGSDSDAAYHIGSTIVHDWILIKVDSLGQRQWRRMIAGTGYEAEYGNVFNAPGGGYYLVGASTSSDSDLTADNVWTGGQPAGQGVTFMHLSDSGRINWCKRWGSNSGGFSLYSAVLDLRDTSLLATGGTNGNGQYFSGNHLYPNGQPSDDMYLLKVDKNGDFVRSKLIGDIHDEEAYGIGIRPEGGYLLVGTDRPYNGLPTSTHYGNRDAVLIAVDENFNQLSTKRLGSIDNDKGVGAFYRGGKWIVTGTAYTPPMLGGTGTTGSGGHPQGNVFVSQVEMWPASVAEFPSSATSRSPVKLIPNPARREVTCVLPDGMKADEAAVYDAGGRVRYRKSFRRGDEMRLDIRTLEPGNYVVQLVERGQKVSVAPLVVE